MIEPKNKLRLKNQDNVATRQNFVTSSIFPGNIAKPDTFASRRNEKKQCKGLD